MKDINGEGVSGKEGFAGPLIIIFFPEERDAAEGDANSREGLENGHAEALPVPTTIEGAGLGFAENEEGNEGGPNSQTAKEADAAPAFTRRRGQRREPAMAVGERTGDEESDILGEIAKLHIVPGRAVQPDGAYEERGDGN